MRSQDAVSLVVVLVLVAGCSSGDGGEPDATPSAPTTVETTTTVAETTTTVLAADEAKIEITYTDDGTAYVGDRMIVEGTATVRFSNETASEAVVILFWYEPGSAGVAEELEYLLEGDHGVPIGDPAEGWVEVELEGSGAPLPEAMPGRLTWYPAPTSSMWAPWTFTPPGCGERLSSRSSAAESTGAPPACSTPDVAHLRARCWSFSVVTRNLL